MPPDVQAIATFLSVVLGGIAAAAIKAKADVKKRERKMQSVPPSSNVPALPHSPQVLQENEQLRLALRRERWRAEEAERIARELTDEQARTSAALSAERAAHVSTHEMLRHYRARIYELEDKQRSIDSGFTPLGIVPPQLPTRVVEEDARPTPKQGMPAWRKGKERKP